MNLKLPFSGGVELPVDLPLDLLGKKYFSHDALHTRG